MIKKNIILLTVCVLGISFFSSSKVYASELQNEEVKKNVTIQTFLSDMNEMGDYSAIKFLKNVEGDNRYIYLPFSTEGYLIYDMDLDIIHEYSTVTGNSYIEGYNDIYYTSALGYYEKDSDQDNIFVEIATGKVIGDYETFSIMAESIDNSIIEKNNISGTLREAVFAGNTSGKISGKVPNYSYNPDGICGSTAAGMYLRWYDLNVNGNYVPSSLESSDGVNLIKHLRGYIDGSKPGSTTGDVYSGIISYCSAQGIKHNGGYALVDISYVIGRVDTYETPFILGLYNHPTYKNHWVTGYGFSISGGSNFATVNDGWANTEVSINLINCDYIIW